MPVNSVTTLARYFEIFCAGKPHPAENWFHSRRAIPSPCQLPPDKALNRTRKRHAPTSLVVNPLQALIPVECRMAPTVLRDGQFRLFFFSREEKRIHVHVAHPDGEAKFWLTPVVALANHTGLSERQLREAQTVVEAHIEELNDAWNQHFDT